MPKEITTLKPEHRFLDETGDTTFYGKGRKLIVGQNGVSLSFGLGVVRIDRPLEDVRREVRALEAQVGINWARLLPKRLSSRRHEGDFQQAQTRRKCPISISNPQRETSVMSCPIALGEELKQRWDAVASVPAECVWTCLSQKGVLG